jgi:glycosyltransferase involved in cell wall biosynthesis
VEVVYNPINRDIFKPTPSDFRKIHGLEGKTVILGVASVWDDRKGLEDFVQLSRMLEDPYKIVLIGLSQEQIHTLPPAILGLPRTNSMEQLAQAYTAADLYVSPSTEESFGMTAMEARCCGTEAIVYKGTACEEIVNAFGGIAVDRGAENLCRMIRKLSGEEVI